VIALAGADAVAIYTLREMFRRKVLYFLVGGGAGLILIAGIAAAVAKAAIPSLSSSAVDFSGFVLVQMANFVSLFAWIAAIAISVTLISQDLESGAAVSIFAKPVSRLAYTIGKLGAAVSAMLLIIAILGVGTQIVVAVNGGGHEGPLLKTFALICANQLTQMLVIMVFSVLMNNIVAAALGIILIQVAKFIAFVNLIMTQVNGFHNSAFDIVGGVVTALYWVVPRYLDSDLQREVYQNFATQSNGGPPATTPVSGGWDVLYWAGWIVILVALLYLVIRRREV
jgi:ABC-type transport system involved in multi-copper enzyme maturation permease subunit